jgi:hypothetical protein
VKNSCLNDDNGAVDSSFLSENSYYPLVQTPPLPQCELCVIVPVHNEAELLGICLNATVAEGRQENRLESRNLT